MAHLHGCGGWWAVAGRDGGWCLLRLLLAGLERVDDGLDHLLGHGRQVAVVAARVVAAARREVDVAGAEQRDAEGAVGAPGVGQLHHEGVVHPQARHLHTLHANHRHDVELDGPEPL